ncbi:MAG: hypothetical protein ACR2KZ_07165, partial [Segetibacter sp.]
TRLFPSCAFTANDAKSTIIINNNFFISNISIQLLTYRRKICQIAEFQEDRSTFATFRVII